MPVPGTVFLLAPGQPGKSRGIELSPEGVNDEGFALAHQLGYVEIRLAAQAGVDVGVYVVTEEIFRHVCE